MEARGLAIAKAIALAKWKIVEAFMAMLMRIAVHFDGLLAGSYAIRSYEQMKPLQT